MSGGCREHGSRKIGGKLKEFIPKYLVRQRKKLSTKRKDLYAIARQ